MLEKQIVSFPTFDFVFFGKHRKQIPAHVFHKPFMVYLFFSGTILQGVLIYVY